MGGAEFREGRSREQELTGFSWEGGEEHSRSLRGRGTAQPGLEKPPYFEKVQRKGQSLPPLKEINTEPTGWGQIMKGLNWQT